MRISQQIVLFILAFFSACVWAQSDQEIETCRLTGTLILQGPTGIICSQDLIVDPGFRLIMNGYPLDILVEGNLAGSEPVAKLTLTKGEMPSPSATPISIQARTAMIPIEIEDSGAVDSPLTSIELSFVSLTDSYSQRIQAEPDMPVKFTLNGTSTYLKGPNFSLH